MAIRYRMPHPPRRAVNLHAVLVLFRLFDRILSDTPSPVTLGLIVFLFSTHTIRTLHLPNLPSLLHPLTLPSRQLCLSPIRIFHGEHYRLLTSSFVHSSLQHIAYNTASLYSHGRILERRYGSVLFAILTALLLVLAHTVYVGFAMVWRKRLERSCVVGASGVLFAMATVRYLTEGSGSAKVWGVQMDRRLAPFAEVLIVAILLPRASFAGHIAGVVAGFIVVFVRNMVRGRRRGRRLHVE